MFLVHIGVNKSNTMTTKRPKTADAHLLTPVEFHLEPRSNAVVGQSGHFGPR